MADPCRSAAKRFAHLALTLLAVALVGAPAAAQAPDPGLYLSIASPLTSEAVTRVDNALKAAKAKDRPPATVVFDFNPGDKDAAGTDWAAAFTLADVISQQTGSVTVAYVHEKVSGHAVLPVLACQQLVCGPKAKLGEVVAPGEPPLTGARENSYADVAARSRPAFVEVARKMHNKDVQLRRAKKEPDSLWYADARDPAKLARDKVTITNNAPVPGAADGRVGLFTASQLRDLDLSRRTIESRTELLEIYRLPPTVLRDGLSGRAPLAFRYMLRGQIDGGVKESLTRIIADAGRNNATVVLLQLEASGGDPQAARELAEKLVELQQGEQGLRVVAFIPDRAPDTAAIVALGCSEIVMSRRKDAADDDEAELGDFDTAAGKAMQDENLEFWAKSLRELAERQGYPPLVVEGMIRRDLEINQYQKRADPNQRRYAAGTEDPAELAKAGWVLVRPVKAKGQLLKLTATQAEELGLARFTVDGREQAEVYQKLGLDPSKVRDATPAWLDRLASFLKNPFVTALLVVVGFTGLILELKVPGATVPGILAALCFILVFWAHTQFSGQVAVLAGLLFIMGLVLILLEIFVLPGFGVPGIVGIALMLGALGLATAGTADGQFPTTATEWTRLGGKMAQYLFGMIAAVFLSFTIARYLPNVPYMNRMMLVPPGEQPYDPSEPSVLPGVAQAVSLLGAVGIAVTVLRPAGSVRFGDEFVDVVTEGSYVPAGSRVQVVEVEGNRIVVKEV